MKSPRSFQACGLPLLQPLHMHVIASFVEAPGVVCGCRWGRETFEHLVGLVHSGDAVQAGVQLCYAHCLFLAPEPDPFWKSSVHGFR